MRRRNTGKAGHPGKFDSFVRPAGELALDLAPTTERPRTHTFEESLAQARDFYVERGAQPDRGSEDAAERRLAAWVDQQRGYGRPAGIRGRVLTSERRARLDADIPWWNSAPSFDENLSRAHEWLRTHPYRPIMSSKDAEERLVANWLIRVGRASTRLSPEERAQLDDLIPDWAEDRWADKTERAGEWVREHGRLPAQTAKDAYERTLGIFLRDARVMDKQRPTVDDPAAERRRLLDELVPGWRGVDLEVAWRENALQVMDWEREHGQAPKPASKDTEEARLGKWRAKAVTLARSADRRITPERRAFIAETLRDQPELASSWAAFETAVQAEE